MEPIWQLRIMASQYFLYYAVIGVFLPYFNLYCHHLGFTGFEIGVLSGVRSLSLASFPVAWSLIADRFQIRKPIFIGCNFLSCAVWFFYFRAFDFSLMFWLTIVYGFFYSPIISFMEAATMDALGGQKARYGKVRAWGTAAFILTVTGLGPLMDHFPIAMILPLIFWGSFLQAGLSLKIPETRARRSFSFRKGLPGLFHWRVRIFLFCGFIMLVSHGAYYGFFSIHLEALGYSRSFIGMAWALASAAEIIVMIRSDVLFRKIRIDSVLFFSFMAATLRWSLLSGFTSAPVILLSQLLHAATYAGFHIGSILFIDRSFPEGAKTVGQTANNSLSYGMGMMIGFLLSGYGYEYLGAPLLFSLSAMTAFAGGMVLKLAGITSKSDGISGL